MRHRIWLNTRMSHSHVCITLFCCTRICTYRVDDSEKICHFLLRNSFNREKCDVLILKWSIWELYSTAWHHFWAQLNNNYEWDGISMQFQVTCQWQFVTDTARWTCLLLKFSQFFIPQRVKLSFLFFIYSTKPGDKLI